MSDTGRHAPDRAAILARRSRSVLKAHACRALAARPAAESFGTPGTRATIAASRIPPPRAVREAPTLSVS